MAVVCIIHIQIEGTMHDEHDVHCLHSTGKIKVNGAPVNGFKTLQDGTEVYTLERFLDAHKGRLDEAFQHLSSQAHRVTLGGTLHIGQYHKLNY